MYVKDKNRLWLCQNKEGSVVMNPRMANRHGLIAGATGTGKTVTMKVLAESFSEMGVPVFMADIKGDVSGLALPGEGLEGMQKRLHNKLGLDIPWSFEAYPVEFWDVFGKGGLPVRTTVSEMGPDLLSRLLGLTEAQSGVLNIVFRIADDENLALLDFKDLRAMVQYVGDNADRYKTSYGNVAKASIAAIQRELLSLEDQGANVFFGEPALDINDWFRCDATGKGIINILHCVELFQKPLLYSTFLLWMLSEVYSLLPEVGDLDKPKMVFFFDEAHLIFNDAPKSLLQKVEQVVRLVRSKGVGVYFVTQQPSDIPDTVLSQLGAKFQHALRAYTPKDMKGLRVAARSFRHNPQLDEEQILQELGTGEVLVSVLDDEGVPTMAQRAWVMPPRSLLEAVPENLRQRLVAISPLYDKYAKPIDRESAYEKLSVVFEEANRAVAAKEEAKQLAAEARAQRQAAAEAARQEREAERQRKANQSMAEKVAIQFGKRVLSTAMTKGSNKLLRTVLGTLFK